MKNVSDMTNELSFDVNVENKRKMLTGQKLAKNTKGSIYVPNVLQNTIKMVHRRD